MITNQRFMGPSLAIIVNPVLFSFLLYPFDFLFQGFIP